MGKETAIGLVVILILLITFGVVLVRRINGPTDSATPSVEDTDNDSSKAEDDSVAKDDGTGPTTSGPGKLRVLAAKPVTNQMSKYEPPAVNQLAVIAGEEVAQVSRPSTTPDSPAPAWANPYDRYGSDVQQTQTPRAQQVRPVSTSAPVGDGQSFDSLKGQAAQTAVANPSVGQDYASPGAQAQSGQTTNALRSLGPPRQTPLQAGGNPYDSPDSGGYSAESSDVRQAPAWRQSTPYPYPQQSQQARTLPAASGSSSLDPLYETGEFRNEDGDYEVQPNDSYWVISQKLYGSGAYFKALAEHNRRKVPREDRLAVGEVISAPDVLELEKAYADLCPKPSRRETVRNRASLVSTQTPYAGGRIYVVEEGDTLFDIARYELGKASRWVEIQQLNRGLVGKDADYISPGMRLVLPDDEPSARVTQRPRSIYQP